MSIEKMTDGTSYNATTEVRIGFTGTSTVSAWSMVFQVVLTWTLFVPPDAGTPEFLLRSGCGRKIWRACRCAPLHHRWRECHDAPARRARWICRSWVRCQ